MFLLGFLFFFFEGLSAQTGGNIYDVSCYNKYDKGVTYNGTVSRGFFHDQQKTCINWKTNNSPFTTYYPDHNYCRNPRPDAFKAPWCYIGDNFQTGICNIPVCDCRNSTFDLKYNGRIYTTRNGNTCLLWKKSFIYRNQTANYCRTPPNDGDNAGGPWCYVVSGWGRCNIPVCGGSVCPDLSTYHLLTMDKKSKYQYGEIAIVVSCQKGYRHIEKTYLECTSTGTWNDTMPTCEEITCKPFILDNNVHASIQPDLNKYVVNTRVTFSCIPGYTGSNTVAVCLANGHWSSQQTQICTPVNCKSLNLDSHVKSLIKLPKYNDLVTLSCEEGYVAKPLHIKCDTQGNWPLERPNCIATMCSMLLVDDKVIRSENISKYNDNVTLSCKEGYNGIPLILKCNANGVWPLQRPNCTAVPCPELSNTKHMKQLINHSGYHYGDIITFQCVNGYILSGPPFITCRSTRNHSIGYWSDQPPLCAEKSLSYKDSMKNRGKGISYELFGGILAAIVSISAGLQIATCFYYRKRAGKSATVYEDMKFNTVERQITSNEDTYSELT